MSRVFSYPFLETLGQTKKKSIYLKAHFEGRKNINYEILITSNLHVYCVIFYNENKTREGFFCLCVCDFTKMCLELLLNGFCHFPNATNDV